MGRFLRRLAALAVAAVWGLAQASGERPITVLHVQPYVHTVNPQSLLYVQYRFAASAPTRVPMRVFVHVLDAGGRIVHQDDHDPPVATTQWWGDIAYERAVQLPASLTGGRYRIAVGLFDRATRWRTALGTGGPDDGEQPRYVREESPGSLRYQVGELYVTPRQIVDAPFACDGRDVTLALARALRNLAEGQLLKLPAGTCRYAGLDGLNALRLDHKRDVEVVGQGAPSTRLLALNRHRSGFIVSGSAQVLLRDFRIEVQRAPGLQERTGNPDATGVYVENSADVELRQLAIVQPLAQGISFYRSSGGRATRNFVALSAADGIHVAGPSSNMVLDQNLVFDVGDDALSSIGYSAGAHAGDNHDIVIENNRARFRDVKWGSGIAVEGTTGAVVRNNTVERSGSAGIRVASINGDNVLFGHRYVFRTGGVRAVEVSGNALVDVKTRPELGHGAIHIAAHTADVTDVRVSGNTITASTAAGTATDAIMILGSANGRSGYYVRDTRVWNNRVSSVDPALLGGWCLRLSAYGTVNLVLGRDPQGQAAPNTHRSAGADTARSAEVPCTVASGPTQ